MDTVLNHTGVIQEDRPSSRIRFGGMFMRWLKTVQYAKMLDVLSSFNDEQLKRIGLTRADIPAYAHKLIYKDG